MRLLSQTYEGIYVEDPFDGVHPELLERYYGVDDFSESGRLSRGRGRLGELGIALDDNLSDTSSDADGSSDEELILNGVAREIQQDVAYDQQRNVRHKPIKVARHASPFDTSEEEELFFDLLREAQEHGYVPAGFGVTAAEWESAEYPDEESICIGARGKLMSVPLPRTIWLPRAVRWAQALDILTRILDKREQVTADSDSMVESEEDLSFVLY